MKFGGSTKNLKKTKLQKQLNSNISLEIKTLNLKKSMIDKNISERESV